MKIPRPPSADELRLQREDELVNSFSDSELEELKPMVLETPTIKNLPDFAKKMVIGKPIRQSRILRAALYNMMVPA